MRKMPYDNRDLKYKMIVFLRWTKENAVADYVKETGAPSHLVETLSLASCSTWPERVIVWTSKAECITCKSRGFEVSKLGPDRCEFCDGTFSGNPPTEKEIEEARHDKRTSHQV